MQMLSKSDDRIQIKFTNFHKLYRMILDKLLNIAMRVEWEEINRMFNRSPNRFSGVIVSEEPNKIESGLLNAILNDKEMEFPDDNEFFTFADTSEKITEDEIKENKLFLETQLKVDQRDFETIENVKQESEQEMKTNLTTNSSGDSRLIFNNSIGPDDLS